MLKTRRLGYDGKGQHVLPSPADVERPGGSWAACRSSSKGSSPSTARCRRSASAGEMARVELYPLVENHHRDGSCADHRPCAERRPGLQRRPAKPSRSVMAELDYVGVLTIEFFQKGEPLIANEMAPRVHNSGHWTIEGARTSQFENHLRAVVGWPLGPAESVAHSAMVNLIGSLPEPARVLAIPGTHLHFYGKKPRPGRKVGHATIWAETPEQVAERVARLRAVLGE